MFDGMSPDAIWTVVGLWAFMGALVALMAGGRGRSPLNWFLISFLFSPLIAFVALAVQPNLKKERTAQTDAATLCPRCQAPRDAGQRVCAKCGLDFWADYDARRA